ncbi:homoserine dehydrogenase [Thermoflavimicrobium dichotomicum]|uniref:Homoserine dehydrogenase n=1 Tax=Thermoflavimicrobium dichotomicum TaxID=46223 RepID=A0A1I3PYT5_9BACL|nr:homoserine dehydrogenase [Thermoflavimicrobium dichotomicum]SFJ26575.1 homoserine dehydrogenase [Thermoflavimicrobium dichotomicum]
MNNETVKVGLMGFGTVGTGVVRIIQGHQEDLVKQTGLSIQVEKILVQNLNKKRSLQVPSDLLTTNAYEILYSPDIDVVIEVMGGIHPAKEYILTALEQGKHVVTANKDLMALHGEEILSKAKEKQCDVFYEASVAGGIPILRALIESFSSDRITKIMGIINGTTNYILSKMSQEGADYQEALQEAQALGYAEADPTSDVEGLDAARKMVILSTLGFHIPMKLDEVEVKGISQVTKEDIAYAKKLGYEMKLLGLAEQNGKGIEVSVEPTLVHKSHPLASVHGVFNAIYVHGEAVGETMFYGPGAGELPTATSVVSDLVTVVKNMKLLVNGQGISSSYKEKKLKADDHKYAKYFLRMIVSDQPGVFTQISQALAEQNISLATIVQQPHPKEKQAEIIIITHRAAKSSLNQALSQMENMAIVSEIKSCYRVEGGEAEWLA